MALWLSSSARCSHRAACPSGTYVRRYVLVYPSVTLVRREAPNFCHRLSLRASGAKRITCSSLTLHAGSPVLADGSGPRSKMSPLREGRTSPEGRMALKGRKILRGLTKRGLRTERGVSKRSPWKVMGAGRRVSGAAQSKLMRLGREADAGEAKAKGFSPCAACGVACAVGGRADRDGVSTTGGRRVGVAAAAAAFAADGS